MGSGLSREQQPVKSSVKSSRISRPKGSLHSLVETDEEEEDAGCCDCDCCREQCDCDSVDGHMTLVTDRRERKLRCSTIEMQSSTNRIINQ